MLQHQWHQLNNEPLPINSSFSGECNDINSASFLSKHIATSTPNKTGQVVTSEQIIDLNNNHADTLYIKIAALIQIY